MTNHNIPATRAFLFDLDGTLIDSKADIVASVNAMLRQTGRAELPLEIVASYIGHGAPQLMADVLGPSTNEASRREALAIFLEHYEQHNLDATRAYPGVAEGLQALAEHPMAVLTNKPAQISVEIVKGLGLADYFRLIYGGDSFEKKKPDPSGALAILRELGVSPAEAAMVGDSDVDIQTARNAGMLAVAVNYGFGKYDRIANPADVYVESLTELVNLTTNHRR
jgi:phosphoglycolate phosphatase